MSTTEGVLLTGRKMSYNFPRCPILGYKMVPLHYFVLKISAGGGWGVLLILEHLYNAHNGIRSVFY